MKLVKDKKNYLLKQMSHFKINNKIKKKMLYIKI